MQILPALGRGVAATVAVAVVLLAATATAAPTGATPAEFVLTNARIYTAAGGKLAEALAVRNGLLVYVGDAAGVQPFIGRHTSVSDEGGRLIVPGLVDAHVHALDIVDLDVCDLDSKVLTLRQLSGFVADCLHHYRVAPGKWLKVHQWNPTAGNQPDADFPTLRAALDKAAPKSPVELLGNDGHHGAFNSAALATAKNPAGKTVGMSRTTLAGDFAEWRKIIGTDERGEPNGAVNEDARYALDPQAMLYNELEKVSKVPEKVPARLNSVGITAFMDAMASPEGMPVYDKLLRGRHMTVRGTLAQFYDPSHTRTADGRVDYDGMVAKAEAVRAHFAQSPYLRADFIKMFADGVVEANPFAVPPTLGNAAMLEPYLQPIFTVDADGHPSVTGYVDTGSAACIEARSHAERYQGAAEASAFMKLNGFHPGQCQISSGQLQHEREIELEYVKRMHLAGFNLHIHVIGDRALRTALDAIEAARAADGNSATHDSLAHVQLAHPADIARIGRDHLYVAFTYSWASVDLDYDMTVIPFLQKVSGNSLASRHVAGSYYEENTYPFRAAKDAGAILVAGSDAPVNTRDPQPFVNMAIAVTRRTPGQPQLNPRQAIGIRDVLDAYTINGARMLGRDKEIGSLEVGKSADFALLDRDILALADAGKADDINGTKVLETWFQGRRVYRARH
jgi:predicted amidohydrolase YtcJ